MRSGLCAIALLAAPAALALAASTVAAPRPVPASDLLISRSSPEIDWRWRMAPEAATAPTLLAVMRGEATKEATRARTEAISDAASARKAGFPFRRHAASVDWSLAADTQRLLALTGETSSFTGGAHGNIGYGSRIWDKVARRSIAFDALFTNWPQARAILQPAFCKALADEQRQRLGTVPRDEMHACPKLAEQPATPWAGLTPLAGQMRVMVAPYVAGPYAEGSYIVSLPWPEAVRPLVKPVYRRDLFGPSGP